MLSDKFKATPSDGFEHDFCSICKKLFEREFKSQETLCPACRSSIVNAAEKLQPNQAVKLTLPTIEPSDPGGPIKKLFRCPYCKEDVLKDETAETMRDHWFSGTCPTQVHQAEITASTEPFNIHNNMWDIIAIVNISRGQKFQDAFLNADAYIKARDEYLRNRDNENKS